MGWAKSCCRRRLRVGTGAARARVCALHCGV